MDKKNITTWNDLFKEQSTCNFRSTELFVLTFGPLLLPKKNKFTEKNNNNKHHWKTKNLIRF